MAYVWGGERGSSRLADEKRGTKMTTMWNGRKEETETEESMYYKGSRRTVTEGPYI